VLVNIEKDYSDEDLGIEDDLLLTRTEGTMKFNSNVMTT
jgi:hypothetical protein